MKGKGNTSTREKLLNSAVDLFSQRWYESVSIVEICKNAGLSNGAFYKYFSDKEEVFKNILDTFMESFPLRFQTLPGSSIKERLTAFYTLLFQANREDWKYINIFREGEYRYPEYERKLRRIYMDILFRIYQREVRESEYLYALGGVRFLVRRPVFQETRVDPETLTDLVMGGIFKSSSGKGRDYLDTPLNPPLKEGATETRDKLIQAGIELFGSRGYHTVNVFEISRAAGFSVGTFYIHFKSKEEFLAEVIRHIGKGLRHYIGKRIDRTLPRVRMELQGWLLFLSYFSVHLENYEIARDAEFAASESVREYYDELEKRYSTAGIRIPNTKLAVNYLLGIGHHLGIEYFFSKSFSDPVPLLVEMEELLTSGMPR